MAAHPLTNEDDGVEDHDEDDLSFNDNLQYYRHHSLGSKQPLIKQQQQQQQQKQQQPTALLQPFRHQVGGHGVVLRASPDRLCKPLNERERTFYESLSTYTDLRLFSPTYYGTIDVKSINIVDCDEDNDCNKTDDCRGISENSDSAEMSSPACQSSASTTVDASSSEGEEEECQHIASESLKLKAMCNPWSITVYEKHMLKLRKKLNTVQEYIVIEDLTANMQQPCILDLKMGTRQHGDDATEEKKRRMQAKCAASTSATLGVRLGGMQVFRVSNQTYKYIDKYVGRTLTMDGFRDALFQFLFNGEFVRYDIIPQLVRKLSKLRTILLSLESYRFYSSSLLLLYEGDPTAICRCDVRMVDFAHTTYRNFKQYNVDQSTTTPCSLDNSQLLDKIDEVEHFGSDHGYILGVSTAISYLNDLLDHRPRNFNDIERRKPRQLTNNISLYNSSPDLPSFVVVNSSKNSISTTSVKRSNRVDVNTSTLLDFENCIHDSNVSKPVATIVSSGHGSDRASKVDGTTAKDISSDKRHRKSAVFSSSSDGDDEEEEKDDATVVLPMIVGDGAYLCTCNIGGGNCGAGVNTGGRDLFNSRNAVTDSISSTTAELTDTTSETH